MRCLTDSEIDELILNARRVRNRDELMWSAMDLVRQAGQLGLVLTIEQVPAYPLAMGNYSTRVSAREARKKA